MAQSPETATPEANELERYLLNWSALGQMIDEGRSFSGYERNCAFLNVNGKSFATVSASSGLDLMDDARAVATCDWNFDGKLDFWVTNRTAPKVRLLMNESAPAPETSHFVALRLKGGKNINRDAIGARIEIYPDTSRKHYIRTLHAGDGFIAQSSRWLHFGLGSLESIDRVIVRWPGASAEPFTGVTPGGFFELEQGNGTAKSWEPPAFALPAANPATASDSLASTPIRTWLIGRVPFPRADYNAWDGARKPLHSLRGKPLAINLWSTTCNPCLAELQEWKESASRFDEAGVQVLTLTVDGLDPSNADGSAAAEKLATELQLPFLAGNATAKLVEAMEIVHRTFVALKKPLPVPSTFLLDQHGRVAAIYQGRTAADTLLRDVALLEQPVEVQRDQAVPFAGSWASIPYEADPLRVALSYSAAGKPDLAIGYLKDTLEEPEVTLAGVLSEAGLKKFKIDGQAMVGQMHLDAGDPKSAASAYAELLTLAPEATASHRAIGENLLQRNLAEPALAHLNLVLKSTPNDASLLFNIALAETATNQPEAAIKHFKAAVALAPDDLATHFQLGNALLQQKDVEEAIVHYREALRIEPNWPLAAHQLAWLLATQPNDALRNGEEALALAEAVCQRDGGGNPVTLHTWSAALAELGRFPEALQISTRAAQIAEDEPRFAKFLEKINEARALYRKRRPLRSR
ncbi:MAG: tetratricopeptide repeat protein [Verrucomicrobiales bacterium]